MIELKKKELESVLLTISAYSLPKEGEQQRMISGLLKENITLGTKRRLQKIHKIAQELYKEFIEHVKEAQKECGEDKEKLESELKILLEEVVKIDAEPIQLAQIEGISTTENYNFEIIEKFAI